MRERNAKLEIDFSGGGTDENKTDISIDFDFLEESATYPPPSIATPIKLIMNLLSELYK